MTHTCCPPCRLRFEGAAAAHLVACPHCGAPPTRLAGARGVLGFRLSRVDVLAAPPMATAAVLTLPLMPDPHA